MNSVEIQGKKTKTQAEGEVKIPSVFDPNLPRWGKLHLQGKRVPQIFANRQNGPINGPWRLNLKYLFYSEGKI